MTNAKAKQISIARKQLNKAENRYFRTGDIADAFNIINKQDSLAKAYNDTSSIYYTM